MEIRATRTGLHHSSIKGVTVMQLTSGAFGDGETIPRRFTADGDNMSPPLSWTSPPKGTRSFAVLCDDPDAPNGTWRHWAIFDIPSDCRQLTEHVSRGEHRNGLRQAENDFHRFGYDGPAPAAWPRPPPLPFSSRRARRRQPAGRRSPLVPCRNRRGRKARARRRRDHGALCALIRRNGGPGRLSRRHDA